MENVEQRFLWPLWFIINIFSGKNQHQKTMHDAKYFQFFY
jgi:hypothetical protein